MTRAAFEFPEVLFRRFPGEDLDLKQHSRVVLRCHEDLADILVDELLRDDSLRRVTLGIRQDSADFVDLLLEGVSLGGCLLQFCDFLFGFFYFTIAVSSHLLEIRVRNTVVCGKLQELVLLPVCLIDDVILLFDLFPERAVLRQLIVHTDIFFHHRIGVCCRVTEHLEQQRFDLAFVDGKGSAGIRAVFDLAGTEPFTVLSPALVLGFAAVVGLPALRTP